MGARVENVGAALMAAQTGRHHPVERGHQRRCAVDHSRVDDLTPARALRFENAADHAEGEIKRTAPEIADQVQRRRRGLAVPPEGMHSAGERDVVEVVSGGLRERPFLAPTGDPAIDKAGIAGEAVLRAKAEPLHHPRAEPFDQRVGAFDQAQGERLALRTFEVERQTPSAPQQEIVAQRACHAEIARFRSIDAQHGRAKIGEQHRAHRPRPDAREFDDLDAGERSHDAPPLRSGGNLRGAARRVKPPPRRGNAALSSSLPFRETQGKKFLRLVQRRKVVFDQYLACARLAESKARQGSGRETRKPSDRRLASAGQCYYTNSLINIFSWLRHMGAELRFGKPLPRPSPHAARVWMGGLGLRWESAYAHFPRGRELRRYSMSGPLVGIRVVDLTSAVLG